MNMSSEKQDSEGKSQRDLEPEDQAEAKKKPDMDASMEKEDQEDAVDEFDVENGEKEEKSTLDIDWENRVLCQDGNCIGVIGPDGFCKECGSPYRGGGNTSAPEKASDSANFVFGDKDDEGPNAQETVTENSAGNSGEDEKNVDFDDVAQKPDADLEWEQRKLCSDGNCIGVIGPDGLCKECGKPYESNSGGER